MASILIAEDDRDQREMLSSMLSDEGYTVNAVDNGTDASQELGKTPYDLAILDVGMPGKDGVTVLKELRERKSSIPVIIMSAFVSEAEHNRYAASGATASLSKPYRLDALLGLIKTLQKRNLLDGLAGAIAY